MITYYRPALLAARVRSCLRVRQWPGGPRHVYVELASGERRELDPDVADALLALLEEVECGTTQTPPAARAA